MNMEWYAVQTYSGYENTVMNSLRERVQRGNLESCFGEIMIPKETVVEMRGGKKHQVERRFFPGYILVEMVMDEKTWHLVNSVPKVVGFIGSSPQNPTPVPDKEIENIVSRIREDASKPRPKVLYEVGEVVRVTSGPFNDFNGIVEEVDYEKNRLLVSVQIFGRSTPVEITFSQVEKT
ncbi:MAG: transcription termination/antitermination protein NusG [Chromatiales bacterium]|nr:transcription termination/antitermination protein NusG [Chromatiales bacterium]